MCVYTHTHMERETTHLYKEREKEEEKWWAYIDFLIKENVVLLKINPPQIWHHGQEDLEPYTYFD